MLKLGPAMAGTSAEAEAEQQARVRYVVHASGPDCLDRLIQLAEPLTFPVNKTQGFFSIACN